MAPGISYDDSGSLANYFGVTFLAVFLVPATYVVFRPEKKDPLKPLCDCLDCQKHRQSFQARKQAARTRRFSRRILPLLLGWAVLAFLCYRIVSAPRVAGEAVYDPFEILGLKSTTEEKAIKKHYKKLSLQYHPDKIQLEPNQTMEEVESKFVELTKAYKALTDETIRENLAKYGNPDGPQQREDKIAIPKWVVEGKSSLGVLAAYGLVLGVGIPYIVGRWWFRQRRTTRDNVLNASAEYFFHSLADDTDFPTLITILAGAAELLTLLHAKGSKSKRERKEKSAQIEEIEKVLQMRREELGVAESPVLKPESQVVVTSAVQKRAKVLIWAHLLRYDLGNKELQDEQQELLLALQPLLVSISNISLAHNWLNTSLLCHRLQANLVQAIPGGLSALSQLPGITFEQAEEVQWSKNVQGKRWLQKFVGGKDEKDAVEGYDEAKRVARRWPALEIVSAEFKVQGEKVVSPSSIVNLNFRVRYNYAITSLSSNPTPAINIPETANSSDSANPKLSESVKSNGAPPESVSSVTEVEDSVGEATGEKGGDGGVVADVKEKIAEVSQEAGALAEKMGAQIGEKVTEKVGKKGKKAEPVVWAKNGYAHAPYWPLNRKPHYSVLLGDSKLDKVIVPPIRITDIPLPRPDGLPSEPREFSLTFPAPPQANLYSFVLYAVSDTYVGNDIAFPIMMKVDEQPEEASDDEDDISEPDEDTLAGQMALMKGSKVKKSKVHGDDDDDDDEEDDDGEEGGSEYESSSDEEGPKKGRAINEDSDSDSD